MDRQGELSIIRAAAVWAASTERLVFHRQRPYRCTAANWRLGPTAVIRAVQLVCESALALGQNGSFDSFSNSGLIVISLSAIFAARTRNGSDGPSPMCSLLI